MDDSVERVMLSAANVPGGPRLMYECLPLIFLTYLDRELAAGGHAETTEFLDFCEEFHLCREGRSKLLKMITNPAFDTSKLPKTVSALKTFAKAVVPRSVSQSVIYRSLSISLSSLSLSLSLSHSLSLSLSTPPSFQFFLLILSGCLFRSVWRPVSLFCLPAPF
jgi:hypothetical protein